MSRRRVSITSRSTSQETVKCSNNESSDIFAFNGWDSIFTLIAEYTNFM